MDLLYKIFSNLVVFFLIVPTSVLCTLLPSPIHRYESQNILSVVYERANKTMLKTRFE